MVCMHWHKTLLSLASESYLDCPVGNLACPQYCIEFLCAVLHIVESSILPISMVSSLWMQHGRAFSPPQWHCSMLRASIVNHSHIWNQHLFQPLVHTETYPTLAYCRPKAALSR